MNKFMFGETESAAGFVEVEGLAYPKAIKRPRILKPCRECGGRHTPKCKRLSFTRKQEADIWRGILKIAWRDNPV